MKSEAWRSLNPCARAALIEIYAMYNGYNNGEIFMSVRHLARQIGVANGTAQKALANLGDRGFIKISEKGAFSRKVKKATTWILTEHSFAGQTPSKDFMRWKPTDKIQNTVSCVDTVGVIACYRRPVPNHRKAPHGVCG